MPEQTPRRRAVFLDRDGTIAEEVGYLNHAARFRMFPFAPAAIRRLNETGLAVVVVSNQSGVARGYFPESLVLEVNELMKSALAKEGAHLDGVYFCPHSSADGCDCRKPNIGMMQRAERDLGLQAIGSYVVGDGYSDMEMAFLAGAHAILVRSGYGLGEWTWHRQEWPRQPDYIAEDLPGAVDWILEQE
ncbi:MAG TPA: HAD family hydrolase [Candidatus Acidoferrum sp.]|nr:HAD family hydrolase [Candidatus Acidoferrum sp.]